MTEILDLSNKEFKITMINITKSSNGKSRKHARTDGNFKNQKEILESRNTATVMKNAFDELIKRLDTDKKRINELEETLIETSQTEMQRGKRRMKMAEQNIQELWDRCA